MPDKIDKFRFIEVGKKAPKGSKFKGIITVEALFDYQEYTEREEAKENTNFKTDEIINANGYFGYTGSHNAGYTRSSIGVLDTEEKKDLFKKEMRNCLKHEGCRIWENIISIENYQTAHDYGLYSIEDWEIAINKALPRFFKYAHFDIENMHYWFDFHINTEHPHIHLCFFEKKQTKIKGALPPKYLKALKRFTALELEARKKLCNKLDESYNDIFKNKDFKKKELVVNIGDYLKANNRPLELEELFKLLPKEGRLSFNSYNMKDYKPLIIHAIDEIIINNKQIKKSYDEFIEILDKLEENMNSVNNSNISTIKEAELEKMYTRAANLILKHFKAHKDDEKQNNTISGTYSSNDSNSAYIKNTHKNKDTISIKNKDVKSKTTKSTRSYSTNSYSPKFNQSVLFGTYVQQAINEEKILMDEALREFLIMNGLSDMIVK